MLRIAGISLIVIGFTVESSCLAADIAAVVTEEGAIRSEASMDVSVKASVEIEVSADSSEIDEGATGKADCDGEACEDKVCEEGACEQSACEESACTDQGSEVAAEDSHTPGQIVRPTHKQTKVIAVNQSPLPKTSLVSFCLTDSGNILAACDKEVRVFSGDGEYLTSWKLPVTPEAINVGSDGRVYVAGEGELLRLSNTGTVLKQVESSLIAELLGSREVIREETIKMAQRVAASKLAMRDRYVKQVEELEAKKARCEGASRADQAAGDEEEVEADIQARDPVAKDTDDQATAEEAGAETFSELDERKLATAQRMVDLWERIIEADSGAGLTEEELERRVEARLKSKVTVASISEADGEVFMTTNEVEGYGYAVWRMNRHFESPQKIAGDLSGCCGQMDVQASEQGVFVAENSRDRVCRFDRDGKLICEWGHSARSGLEGFGSCCNPMNVNFGPENTVYTAESGTGRIKRYSADGELLELVGRVDIVPGCKKVAIAVSDDGDRIYMLDITRNHIVMMERLSSGEEIDYYEVRTDGAGQQDEPNAFTSFEDALEEETMADEDATAAEGAAESDQTSSSSIKSFFRLVGQGLSAR